MALLLTQLDIGHSFLDADSFLLLNFNVGKDISDGKNRFFSERILIQGLEVEMHLFITFLQYISNCIDVGHVLELIIEQLQFLTFGVSEGMRHFVGALECISGPHGISPENVDIKGILNILLLDLFVQFVAVNNFLVHAVDVVLDVGLLIILSEVETMKLHVHSDTIPVILVIVVLFSDILNIVFEKQLPPLRLVYV